MSSSFTNRPCFSESSRDQLGVGFGRAADRFLRLIGEALAHALVALGRVEGCNEAHAFFFSPQRPAANVLDMIAKFRRDSAAVGPGRRIFLLPPPATLGSGPSSR